MGYVRVSREDEVAENQEIKIREYCDRKGLEVVGFFKDEAVSGAVPCFEREGFRAMMKFVEDNGIGHIVFLDITRLGRDMADNVAVIRELRRRGLTLHFVNQEFLNSINDPAFEKLLLALFSWFAEYERQVIIERTKAGLERARLQGKHIGRPKKKVDRRKVEYYLRKGLHLTDIAKLMDVSYSTLRRRIKEWNMLEKQPSK